MTIERPISPEEVTPAPQHETAPHLAASQQEDEWRPASPQDLAPSHDYEPQAEDRWPGEWHAIIWAFASGCSQNDIARQINYSVSRVSVILNKPQVMRKVAEIRKQHGGEQLERKFARMASPAADLMAAVIAGQGDGRDAKLSERLDASKWALEKVTGKPRQAGDNDAGTTVLNILQALDSLKKSGPEGPSHQERSVLELAEGAAQPADWMDDFLTRAQGETKETK